MIPVDHRLFLFVFLYSIDLQGVINYLNSVSFPIWDQIKGWLIATIINPIVGGVHQIEDYVYTVRDWLQNNINNVSNRLTDAQNWLWSQIQGAYQNAVNWAQSAITNLSNGWIFYWNIIKNYWSQLETLGGSLFGTIYNFCVNLYGRAVVVLQNWYAALSTLINSWWNYLSTLISSWWQFLSTLINSWWHFLQTLIGSWWNFLSTLINSFWGAIVWLCTQALDFLVKLVTDPINTLAAFIFTILKKFVDLTGEAMAFVITALMTLNIGRWMR
jgi:phage-related protein